MNLRHVFQTGQQSKAQQNGISIASSGYFSKTVNANIILRSLVGTTVSPRKHLFLPSALQLRRRCFPQQPVPTFSVTYDGG